MAGIIDPVLLRDYLTVADTLVLIAVGSAIVLYHKFVLIPRVKTLTDELHSRPPKESILTKDKHEEICHGLRGELRESNEELKDMILENRRLSREQKDELERMISVTVKAEILMAIDGKLNRREK